MKLHNSDNSLPLHVYVLRFLHEAGHATNADIMREFGGGSASVSYAFKVLEDSNLIERVRIGREVLVSLSPRGILLMDVLCGLDPHSVYTPAPLPMEADNQ